MKVLRAFGLHLLVPALLVQFAAGLGEVGALDSFLEAHKFITLNQYQVLTSLAIIQFELLLQMNDQNVSLAANLPAGFDDKPIGNRMKFDIPEYAENQGPAMIPETSVVQKLPLSKRLQSNALKNKKQALEQLYLLVKENAKQFRQYEELTPDLISFSHASVVDRSLKIVALYLQGGQQLSLDPKVVIKTVLEKCLATDKAEKEDIKKSCEEVLFWYMDNKYEDHLLTELNDGLLNKNPKIIATALLFIANCLNNYGIKRMKNLERFAKHLDLLASPPKPMAKQQTIEFFKEVYRWMGDNTFKQFKMHMEIKDEIQKFAKDYQRVPMEIKRGVKREGNGERKLYSMDTEENDNQDEIDVLSNFTSRWVDEVLEIQKWKDKKAALDEFIKKTRVNNILPPRDVGHLITLIKRLLAENNINLLLCGFSVTQNLAKGLKKHFSPVAKNVSTFIFLKLKDAKSNIVQAAQETLKSLLYSVGLEDLMDEIKVSLDDKAPAMRVQALKFLANFTNKREPKIMNLLRSMVQKFAKLTEDGAEVVRKEALQVLCNLKKAHGMKYFGDKLKQLDPKKMSAIQLSKAGDEQEMDIEVHPMGNIGIGVIESGRKQQSRMQIEQKAEEKDLEKLQKNLASSKMKPEQPSISIQSSIQPKPLRTVSNKILSDLISPNESVRYMAYQQILAKTSFQDLKPLMYIIKSNAIRQSAPNNLKAVIQIAKKYSGIDPIQMQTLEYIYKHDWKKAKITLQDFLSSNKFTPEASDYIRHNSVAVSNSKFNSSIPQNTAPQKSLRGFILQLESLFSKMTNPIPEVRIESAEHAIKSLESLLAIVNESQLNQNNGWKQECITRFCGMVRFRLNDCEEVAKIYSELLKLMIHKGILTRNKGLKLIMQTIFLKLKERKSFVKEIFEEIASTNPQFLFSLVLAETIREVNEPLIEFIIQNNELFVRNAQLKGYICPFMNLIFNSDMNINLKTELEKILDQIIELNGEHVLETEVKKMKINNASVEQFLAKYNISLNSQSFSSKNINVKSDRLKMDEDNPWPIFAAPTHVLKLINNLTSMKEPLPTLATPLALTDSILDIIMELDNSFLSEFSDLLLKWVYWRTVIDQQQVIGQILRFTYKIVIAVNIYMAETEFTVLLAAMINVLDRFKLEYLEPIIGILRSTFNIEFAYKERSLLFWVNLLTKEQNMKKIPVNEILRLLIGCYSTEALTQHLPTLARSPEVLKNEPFLRFISNNFDHQFLTASGFRVIGFQKQNKATSQLKPLLSDMGGPENMISINPQEKRYYVTLFQKYSSIELQNQIKEINKSTDSNVLIDTHMKIIYSVVVPFMKKEIPIINVFTYFRELARLFNGSEGLKYSHCLKDLTRMLMYFLIDLDENSIENKDEITKTVNKIILYILEKSESRHMLEVLVILLQYQLKLNSNSNSKIQHLIYKCIGKVVKFQKFEGKWRENIPYIIGETNSIFNLYDIKVDHPLIRTIKAIWKNDIIINSSYFNFIEDYFKTQEINPTLAQLFNEVTNTQNLSLGTQQPEDKEKEANPIKGITNTAVNKLISIKKTEIS